MGSFLLENRIGCGVVINRGLRVDLGHDIFGEDLHLIFEFFDAVGGEVGAAQVLNSRLSQLLDLLDQFIGRADEIGFLKGDIGLILER